MLRRGYAHEHLYYDREFRAFILALAEVSAFREGQRRKECLETILTLYLATLRQLLQDKPDLKKCQAHCCQCGKQFLTDPRNKGRSDLRCPFGCRRQHRKEESNKRSTRYYQSDAGKFKKKRLNARRSHPQLAKEIDDKSGAPPASDNPSATTDPADNSPAQSPHDAARHPESPAPNRKNDAPLAFVLDGVTLSENTVAASPVLAYLREIVYRLERVRLTRPELIALLQQLVRQRSLAYRDAAVYFLTSGQKPPPDKEPP